VVATILDQTFPASMLPLGREPTNEGKTLEVELLARQQRIRDEVSHPVDELVKPAGLPHERPIAAIGPDAPAPEVGLQHMKHLCPISVLMNREAGASPPIPIRNELRDEIER
jgi:hypothetical protein